MFTTLFGTGVGYVQCSNQKIIDSSMRRLNFHQYKSIMLPRQVCVELQDASQLKAKKKGENDYCKIDNIKKGVQTVES